MTKVGSLRASDADREETISRLHQAATEGRIGSEELEQRVSEALKARTYGDLDATVADLPRQVGRRSRRETSRRTAGGWALSAVRSNPWLLLFAIPAVAVTAAMLITAVIMWAVFMLVFTVLSGGSRPRAPRGAWMYTRSRHACGPPRRHPRSYWA